MLILNELTSQFHSHNHAQYVPVKISGGPLDNQIWQREQKTDYSIAQVQLCEYENQTLEAFVAASRLSAKFDCPVARRQNFEL